jgi:hypothetical protein
MIFRLEVKLNDVIRKGPPRIGVYALAFLMIVYCILDMGLEILSVKTC